MLNFVSMITGFLTCEPVTTGVFTFVALSFYFEPLFLVFLKYSFLIVHKRKYSQLGNDAIIER